MPAILAALILLVALLGFALWRSRLSMQRLHAEAARRLEAQADEADQAETIRERLGEVFANLPVPVFAIDAEHRVTHWNRACEIVTGMPAEAMIGRCEPWRAFYAEARPVMADVVLDGFRDNQLDQYYGGKYQPSRFIPNCFEAEDFFPQMGPNGVWLAFTAAPLLGPDGQAIGAIETLTDITHRTRAEAALIEERNFLNSLLEAIPTPVFYKDRQGRYLGANEAFLASLGRQREEILGRTVFELAPAEIAQRYYEMDEALFATPGRQVYEWLVHRPGGETRNVVFNKATFCGPDGELAGLIGVILDVSDLKDAHARLEEMNRELETRVESRTRDLRSAMHQLVQAEKLAALGHLVAGVAHELNTPVGTILTLSTTFTDRLKDLAEQLLSGKMRRSDVSGQMDTLIHAAETLTRNAYRAGDLISSFKQVAVDQASMRRRPFDLALTIDETLRTLGPLLKQHRGISIRTEVAPGIVLDSFPGPFEQVLTNLVINSLRHAFEGRDEGRITITAEAGSGTVLIRFADDGLGIPADQLNHVFEPFFTTKLGQGGSGLGLYLVHTLISGQLGGSIEIDRTAETGAVFLLRLPLLAPTPTPTELPRPPQPAVHSFVI